MRFYDEARAQSWALICWASPYLYNAFYNNELLRGPIGLGLRCKITDACVHFQFMITHTHTHWKCRQGYTYGLSARDTYRRNLWTYIVQPIITLIDRIMGWQAFEVRIVITATVDAIYRVYCFFSLQIESQDKLWTVNRISRQSYDWRTLNMQMI